MPCQWATVALKAAFIQLRCFLGALIKDCLNRSRQTPGPRLADWDGSTGRARIVADGVGLGNRFDEPPGGVEVHARRLTRRGCLVARAVAAAVTVMVTLASSSTS